jgi:hypothetical protein
MEKEFIPYELALELKQLGFYEACFGLYAPPCKTISLHHYGLLTAKEQILAPLYQQAFRFFREEYRLSHIWIMAELLDTGEYTYEEAELECLVKLIEIVKNQKL